VRTRISAGKGQALRQVVLYRDHEDDGWVVEVPSLPGCITQGDSKTEALTNARDAIATWIAGAEAVGLPVPDETFDVQVCIV
jgi:predicted RNase H-like HicB family nuclease